jgi:hypothetical protein
MMPRALWSDLILISILALLIRAVAALPQQQPNYMDAAYSYVNALNLTGGKGFVEDFVWNYLGEPDRLPQPSHLYWMPLTTVMAWLGMIVGGVGYRAAQWPFVILSALLAPITYVTAYMLSKQRYLSWLAGLFAIFSGFYFPFWTAIDNFAPFAVFGSLALLFAWRGMSADPSSAIDGLQGSRTVPKGTITGDENPALTPALRDALGSPSPPGTRSGCFTRGESGLRRGEGYLEQSGGKRTTLQLLYFLIAGVCVGLAHLARADGLLLLLVILLVYAGRSVSTLRSGPDRPGLRLAGGRFLYPFLRVAAVLIAGYMLVMTPWFIRNFQLVGTPLPAVGTKTIWLTSYDDLFSYKREISIRSFLAQGLEPILRGRLWALQVNLQTALAVWGMIFLAPLALIGAWVLRCHRLIQLVATYAVFLFMVMTVVFSFPGARGGLFHSGAALLPFIYAAAVVGLDRAVEWATARRRGWDGVVARRVFGIGLVFLAISLSSFIYYRRVIRNNTWNTADRYYPAIAVWVAEQRPDSTIMIGNPPAYRYHGGGLSVIVPNEDLTTTLQTAREFDAIYLVLDNNHPAPLAEIYNNPADYAELSLAETFGQGTGSEIYVFEIIQ